MDDTTTPLGGPAAAGPGPGAGTGAGPAAGPGAPQDGPRSPNAGTLTDIRRTEDGRMVAGVCAGIGRYLGIDPVIPRILFAVLTIVGFGGVLAYAAAWILLPDEQTGESYLKRWLGLGENEPQIRLVGLGAAALVAVTWTWGWGWPVGPLWIAAVAVIAWVAYREYRERKQRRSLSAPPPYGPAQPPYGPAQPPYAQGMPPYAQGMPPQAPRQPEAPYAHTHTYSPPPWAPTPTYGPAPTAAAPVAPTAPRSYAPLPPTPPGPPTPPTPPAPVKQPKRPNPRHDRGTLTVITLSLMLIVTGVTLVTTQGDLAPSVYVATALGTLALGMLVGTVVGNARPLILPAIIAVGLLAFTTVVPNWDAGRVEATPGSAAELRDDYEVGVGEVVVDLREISDPAALDGRQIDLEAGLGTVRVYVPDTLDIDLDVSVGAGSISALGFERGGVQTSLEVGENTDRPDLALNIDVTVGDVEVIRS